MHRSGTSAVTGMLAGLGVDTPAGEDMIPATLSNQRGHFESKTLAQIDNQILHILGGTWSAPPTLSPGWELGSALAAVRRPAADTFAAAFPTRPMVWKDPRNSLVLPFWRSVLAPPLAAVLVYRDAFEVAHSLQTRDNFNLTHGLALWIRYVRTSCADLAGVPTLVVDYGRMIDHPVDTGNELVRFLTDIGIDVDPARTPLATASLDAGLHHQRAATGGPADTAGHPRQMLEGLRALVGAHHPWRAPDFGPEPEWVDDVLALRRQYAVLHRQVRSSRAMRIVESWWKLRGVELPPLAAEGDDA